MIFKKNKKAFTFVELLVVVVLIGILASIAVLSFKNFRRNSRDVKRVSDIREIQMALESYFNSNGYYPDSIENGVFSTSTVYMESIPTAPTPADGDCSSFTNKYVYTAQGSHNGSYIISFCLGDDVDGISGGDIIASPKGINAWSCGYDLVDSRDGQSYGTVQLGSQCWMSRNMVYNNGCSNAPWTNNLDTGWCGCYNNNEANCNTYGRLYQWSAAMNSSTVESEQGVCPSGWHIPTINEILALLSYLSSASNTQYQCGGNSSYIIKSLAATSSSWTSNSTVCSPGNNTSTNNSSMFNAPGSGYKDRSNGVYCYGLGTGCFSMWSSTQYAPYDRAFYRIFCYDSNTIGCCGSYKADARSIRCLKD